MQAACTTDQDQNGTPVLLPACGQETSGASETASADKNLRRCLVTGAMLPKNALIRFVEAPDGSVVPDLAHNLPGRGLWVTAERSAIEAAQRGKFFAKAAKRPLQTGDGLADLTAALLRKRILDLLGLAKRSGIAILGEERTEAAIKAGALALFFVARDAGRDAASWQVLGGRKPLLCTLYGREELGNAFGYAQIVYAGLKTAALAAKIATELQRLDAVALPAQPSHTRAISHKE